ncbi:hypothetical protein SODALDRAFT_359199 [Sodiomyces alkalinus F11]|uniref:Uncharacterized protein n=1 Tax=Sodiomyces alkalinus (strain CBS 110278 / VKM F-3762 / F11) TaxID=1314773 RepID=A0A3N2PXU6_SODAK|nr:hypothetical protein SODALDRAFT_359199 [Sodiomyces alkalinus F11]ROT39317.1 hypothetical protein SODALDRAFT_359199 [Sodiomyces alkalinus F11]
MHLQNGLFEQVIEHWEAMLWRGRPGKNSSADWVGGQSDLEEIQEHRHSLSLQRTRPCKFLGRTLTSISSMTLAEERDPRFIAGAGGGDSSGNYVGGNHGVGGRRELISPRLALSEIDTLYTSSASRQLTQAVMDWLRAGAANVFTDPWVWIRRLHEAGQAGHMV